MSTEGQEKVNIKVIDCSGLVGSKGSNFVLLARVEFAGGQLGESQKLEVQGGKVQLDFSCAFTLKSLEALALDELAKTPVVITFLEILPKDKKSKEEKTNTLGQCCVDLLPLLKGETSFSVVENVHPAVTPTTETPPAEVEIFVSVVHSLLTQSQLLETNLLTVCMKSAYSLPDSWTQNGGLYNYLACMPLPITQEQETLITLPNGVFRAAGEKEFSSNRKWSNVPNACGSCVYIPNTEVSEMTYEEEDGDLQAEQGLKFREEVEAGKPHVTWNAQRRCFLSQLSCENLQQKIAVCRYWPLEFVRTVNNQPVNAKTKVKEEEPLYSYHGVVYLDLAPLLYPGVSRVRGAYRVRPYVEADIQERTQRKGVVNEDLIRTVIGVERSNSSLAQQKTKKEAKNKVTASKENVKHALPNEVEATDSTNVESQQYLEAQTYMLLEIELEKPLVPKRTSEEIVAKIAELIPPRPKFEKIIGGSKQAVADYENEIESVCDLLLEEFRNQFGSELSQEEEDVEERQKRFFHELNSSGKYYAIKERLKYFIVKVVREKFGYKTDFENVEEKEKFISTLYQFLVNHMNSTLNKFLSTEERVKIPGSVTDSHMLSYFATEAEVLFDYNLAAYYHKERLARYKKDSSSWFDYGQFCLTIQDMGTADECFKECVSLDQNHRDGLIMSALMALRNDEFEVCEQLLCCCVHLYEHQSLPWTVLGMYYCDVENTILMEHAFNQANKILEKHVEKPHDVKLPEQERSHSEASSAEFSEGEESSSEQVQVKTYGEEGEEADNVDVDKMKKYKSIFLLAANFFLEKRYTQMAERSLSHELVSKKAGPIHLYKQLLSTTFIQQKDYDQALLNIEQALQYVHASPDGWALKGHVNFLSGRYEEAAVCYERCLVYVDVTQDLHPVLIRLATIYIYHLKRYAASKELYMRLCKLAPSCNTWLGVGVSCCRLGEFSDAEQALNEANVLDNRNPDVWSYLTLVCLKVSRHLEAERCYKYASKLGFSYDKKEIREEIHSTMKEENFDMSVL